MSSSLAGRIAASVAELASTVDAVGPEELLGSLKETLDDGVGLARAEYALTRTGVVHLAVMLALATCVLIGLGLTLLLSLGYAVYLLTGSIALALLLTSLVQVGLLIALKMCVDHVAPQLTFPRLRAHLSKLRTPVPQF